jgi:two-component system cell cycle response regulator
MDVLIAHGSEACRRELSGMLEGHHVDLIEATDGTQALDLLMGGDPPRLALVDWDLPGLEGPELCRLMRDFNLGRPPYLILVTPVGAERDVTAGLLAGADDFIFVPAAPPDLCARVDFGLRAVERPRGEAAGQGARETVRHIEVLPGVDDRETTLKRLEDELFRAQREHAPLSIGLLRVAEAQEAREPGGSPLRDPLPREVVRRLRRVLRPYDGIGRLARDEFLLIMPNTGECDLKGVLERVQQAVCAAPLAVGDRRLDVSATMGGATGLEEEADHLLAQAYAALGEATSGGTVVAGPKVELCAMLTRESQAS